MEDIRPHHPIWIRHCLRSTLVDKTDKAVDQLGGLHTFPYTERLTLLGLERLEVRRIRADLLFVYKLLFGFTALRAEDYFNVSVFTATRSHPYKLVLTRCFTDVRKYFFL